MNGFTDKCHRHPAHAAWNCPDCDAEAAPPPDGWTTTARAALTRRTRTVRRPDPTPDTERKKALRDRIDAEEAQK